MASTSVLSQQSLHSVRENDGGDLGITSSRNRGTSGGRLERRFNAGSMDTSRGASPEPASIRDSIPGTTAVGRPPNSSTLSSTTSRGEPGEFFVEPEWQRVPGRWSRREETLLREMKGFLDEDLREAPPFPEVVGERRMLRFLRGHKYDVQHASKMMRNMLHWRKANGVNDIREDIMKHKKFDPRQFPDGEMITKLFPVLVANPLCVDLDGAPISYESYGFSPRQASFTWKETGHRAVHSSMKGVGILCLVDVAVSNRVCRRSRQFLPGATWDLKYSVQCFYGSC